MNSGATVASHEVSCALSAPCSYAGRRVALLTQHGKESLIGPVLEQRLHCGVERVGGYDTDRLGAFTGETQRAGSQLDAARAKAHIGMALAGATLGLGSEGSFGTDPVSGMQPWNRELILWRDADRDLEVLGWAEGLAHYGSLTTTQWRAVAAFAQQMDFPTHGLVVRPQGEHPQPVRKDIDCSQALEAAFDWAASISPHGAACIEADLRAHANPTRQHTIRRAAEDLAARLARACSACGMPGFGTVGQVPGLPCSACAAPTAVARADILACPKCDHRCTHAFSEARLADPMFCGNCNP